MTIMGSHMPMHQVQLLVQKSPQPMVRRMVVMGLNGSGN